MTGEASETRADGPLGASWDGSGTTFAVFSAVADRIELCLDGPPGGEGSGRAVELARSGDRWHVRVEGVGPGQRYGYRVWGPPPCDPAKLLVDPYATDIDGELRWSERLLVRGEDSAPDMPRSVVGDGSFDWQQDRAPAVPWRDTRALRGTRPGPHRQPPRGPARAAGHLPRPGSSRGHRVPQRPRRDRRRAVARASLRPRATAHRGGPAQLLGLQHPRLLRPACRLRRPAGPAGERAEDCGAGAARSRHRGDPRRGLQPHGGGRGRRADALAARVRRRRLLPLRTGPAGGVHRLDRLRQHAQRRSPGRAGPGARQPASLGPRVPRGRLPLRPGHHPGPGRPALRPQRSLLRGDRPGPAVVEREVDRRALGSRPPRLPAGAIPAGLGGVERSLPRRGA